MVFIRKISKIALLLTVIGSLLLASTTMVVAEQKKIKGKVTIWGGAYLMKTFQDLIESGSFYVRYPEIKLEATGYPYAEYARKMKTAIAARQSDPDLLMVHERWVMDFVGKDILVELTDRINKEKFKDVFGSVTNQEGRIFGLPFEIYVPLNWYREDILRKYGLSYPETFEEYLQVGKKLREQGLYWTNLDPSGFPRRIRNVLGRMKGNIFDSEGNVIFDTEEGKGEATGRIFAQIVDAGFAFMVLEESPEEYTAMKEGKLVGRWSGASALGRMRDAILPKDEAFGKMRIGLPPSLGPGTLKVGHYPVTYIFLSKLGDNPEAAYKIAEYATSSTEGTLLYGNKHLLPSACLSTLKIFTEESSSMALLGGQEFMGEVARFILQGEAGTLNLNPSIAEAQDIISEKFSALLAGEISPEEFAKGAAEKIRGSMGLK